MNIWVSFGISVVLLTGIFSLGYENYQMREKLDSLQNAIVEKNATASTLKIQYSWMTNELLEIIEKYSKEYLVEASIISAIIHAESNGKPKAKSKEVKIRLYGGERRKSNALGLMQIIPDFHFQNQPKERLFTPQVNIEIGVRFFAHCLKLAKGDVRTALKNYNSGPYSRYYNWPYINKVTNLLEKSKHLIMSQKEAYIKDILKS